MNSFTFTTYHSRITSPDEVVLQLKQLGDELKGTDMEHVLPFNLTYLNITKAVIKKLGSGFFNDDAFLQRFDIIFAYYYLNALKSYLANGKAAPAWQLLFERSQHKTTPKYIYMSLGVNAHVNNDIPQVLLELDASIKHKQDYDKVNAIIAQQTKSVIEKLPEDKMVFKITEERVAPLYQFIMEKLITRWRKSAWQHFQRLQKGSVTRQDVEAYALNKGKKLTAIKEPTAIFHY